MLTTFAVSGYRSLVDMVMPVDRLTVIRGANGSGKTNLYRALRVLAAAGTGEIVSAIAREGGLGSVLWAGPEHARGGFGSGSRAALEAPEAPTGERRTGPYSLRIGFSSDDFGYLTDLGLPQVDPARSLFRLDPEVKREQVFVGPHPRPSGLLIDRTRSAARVRDDDGWRRLPQVLGTGQSVLLDLEDAAALPDVLRVRQRMHEWRFYDHLRTDTAAPARQPQVGTRTRWLSDDGADLAAVWGTTSEAGADHELATAVDAAFPGSSVAIEETGGMLRLTLRQAGLLRPMTAAELSDGTLRYLLLCAALLPAEPPPLIVINEPESSLHESLIPALADLVLAASRRTQVILVTHSGELHLALERAGAQRPTEVSVSTVTLESTGAGTEIVGQGVLDAPRWDWPSR